MVCEALGVLRLRRMLTLRNLLSGKHALERSRGYGWETFVGEIRRVTRESRLVISADTRIRDGAIQERGLTVRIPLTGMADSCSVRPHCISRNTARLGVRVTGN